MNKTNSNVDMKMLNVRKVLAKDRTRKSPFTIRLVVWKESERKCVKTRKVGIWVE